MAKKVIPSIHIPIQGDDGGIAWVWYMFFQWVSDSINKIDLSNYFTKEETELLLSAKANIDDLSDVAFSGNYNDLTNKPEIPTVGNGVITITQEGTEIGSFSTNQSTNETIEIGASGAPIDNTTITKNADDELQAVGTINMNTTAGATSTVFDWVGTLAEYQAQNIETLHPDWLCYITDDVSGGESVYTKSQVDTIASGKANVALDNITNAGKEVCANLAMPSDDRQVVLPAVASGGQITVPADGYVSARATPTGAGQFLELICGVDTIVHAHIANQDVAVFIPVRKGAIVTTYYSTGTPTFTFVYANGAQ